MWASFLPYTALKEQQGLFAQPKAKHHGDFTCLGFIWNSFPENKAMTNGVSLCLDLTKLEVCEES